MSAPRSAAALLALWPVALAGGGCRPELGAPPSLISSSRVVAVRFEPPEAAPGSVVMAAALVASPEGTVHPPLSWSICKAPKAVSENDVVSPTCLAADATTALGATAMPLSVRLPADGCRLFGPEIPPATAGEPPPQPRAADVTGGYYQPLRADLDSAATIALARIRCALAGASMDAATEFAARYAANRNPTLTALVATVDGREVALDTLPAGSDVTLRAGFTADSVESFPVLDPQSQALIDHVETMTLSWFTDAGSLAFENSDGENRWTAPLSPGSAHLWIVLRDSRGGVDFAGYTLAIR